MPEIRLGNCRDAYQITNCGECGKPTTNYAFDGRNVCGACRYKAQVESRLVQP